MTLDRTRGGVKTIYCCSHITMSSGCFPRRVKWAVRKVSKNSRGRSRAVRAIVWQVRSVPLLRPCRGVPGSGVYAGGGSAERCVVRRAVTAEGSGGFLDSAGGTLCCPGHAPSVWPENRYALYPMLLGRWGHGCPWTVKRRGVLQGPTSIQEGRPGWGVCGGSRRQWLVAPAGGDERGSDGPAQCGRVDQDLSIGPFLGRHP